MTLGEVVWFVVGVWAARLITQLVQAKALEIRARALWYTRSAKGLGDPK